MPNQEVREPTRNVVIIAPIWLQNVFSLWLQAKENVKWVICAATFEALALSSFIEPKNETDKYVHLIPSLVIFFAPPALAINQVQKIKQLWPTTILLVLADTKQVELRKAGSDFVLSKTFSSEQFLNMMARLPWEPSS